MSSKSQKSFASKLGNAKKLKTIVTSFTEYQAPVRQCIVRSTNYCNNKYRNGTATV